MRWENFVSHIKDLGFDGDADNFDAVVLWLKRNHHDFEKVVDSKSKEAFVLKDLFDERPGKPLDVSHAAEESRIQEMVDQRLAKEMATLEEVYGKDLKHLHRAPSPSKGHSHAVDIKVGKDRLADHPKAGYNHLGLFLKDVITAGGEDRQVSDRLNMWQKAAASTYGSEGTGVDGGFAAPPEMRSAIEDIIFDEGSILGRTRQIPISGTGITFPADETTPWQTSGGIQAYWEGEAGTYAQSKPALVQKELKPRKCTALVPLTEELIADAAALSAYVNRAAGEKIDFKIGEAIFRGNGASQPLGFLNAAATISVAAESSQKAATFLAINALKMWMRLYGPYRTNAVWFINQDVESELFRMSVPGRTAGGTDVNSSWGFPVYTAASSGMAGAPYGSLMGRPIIPTQHCETLGDVGDVCLCAMDQYVTAVRGGLESQSSIHLWFDQDIVALKYRLRLDGQPWLASTISPRDGSNLMSAFVTCAARA